MIKVNLSHYEKLTQDKQLLGVYGEKLAAKYLKKQDCKILYKNFSPRDFGSKGGEIDIVCRDGNTLVFVEVKTRSSHYKRAYDAVDKIKQDYIRKGAAYWLKELKQAVPHRFDIIEIYLISHNEKLISPEIILTKNSF